MWVGPFDRHRHRRPSAGDLPEGGTGAVEPSPSPSLSTRPTRRSRKKVGSCGAVSGEQEAGRRSGSSTPERPTGARVSPGPGLRSAPVRADSSRAPGRLRDRRAIRAPRRSRTPFSRAPSPRVTAPRFPSGRRAAPEGSPPGEGRRPAPERGRHRRRHRSLREPPTLPPPRTPRGLRVAISRRRRGKSQPPAPPSPPAASTPPSTGPPPPTPRLRPRRRTPGEPGTPPALRRKAPPGTGLPRPDGRHPQTHLAPGHPAAPRSFGPAEGRLPCYAPGRLGGRRRPVVLELAPGAFGSFSVLFVGRLP